MPQWFPIALCFTWYSIITASAYLIMPLREALLMVHYGPGVLPWSYMANALATGLTVWFYGRYVHLPRKKLIGGALTVLLASLAAWVFAVRVADRADWVSFLFGVWVDIFFILSVTIFWSTIDDIFTLEGAKARYGLIAAAGPLGAILGSYTSKVVIRQFGPSGMLLLAAGIFALILPIFIFLNRWAEATNAGGKRAGRVREIQGLSQFVEVGKTIAGSKVLLLITAAACLECVVPNLMNYIFNCKIAEAYPQVEDMTEAFSRFFLLTNSIGFLVSVFLTSRALSGIGVGGAMASCALVSFGGFVSFALWPVLITVLTGKTSESILRYTLYKSAKEAVYTVAPREVVYRVKAYIEVFIYRITSGASGLILLVLTSQHFFGHGPRTVAAAGIPLAAAWILVSIALGRAFIRLKERSAK